MQNSIVILTFSFFLPEIFFLGKSGPKNHNCQFKLKFSAKTNSSIQNSMVMFTFFVFDRKYVFWGVNLVQIFKIVSLSWNFVPRPIWICKIQWWRSFFSVTDWKYAFWVVLVQKIKIVSLTWNLVHCTKNEGFH